MNPISDLGSNRTVTFMNIDACDPCWPYEFMPLKYNAFNFRQRSGSLEKSK